MDHQGSNDMSQYVHKATEPKFPESVNLPPLQAGPSSQTCPRLPSIQALGFRPRLPSIHDTFGDILTSSQPTPPPNGQDAGTSSDQLPKNTTTINEADQSWTCVLQNPGEPCCAGNPHYAVAKYYFAQPYPAQGPIPLDVWITYCPKHRTRASQSLSRYNLILTTLERMEKWGGISYFVLWMRMREQIRIDGITGASLHGAAAKAKARASASASARAAAAADGEGEEGQGLKRPRPLPVPTWLQKLAGTTMSFDQVREVIEALHNQAGKSKKAKFPDVVFLPVFR